MSWLKYQKIMFANCPPGCATKIFFVLIKCLPCQHQCYQAYSSAVGTWHITSLQEVERYQLDMVRLTSMRSLAAGTKQLTLHFPVIGHNQLRRAGAGVLIAAQPSCVGVHPIEKHDCVSAPLGCRYYRSLQVWQHRVPNLFGAMLHGALNSVASLGDFITQVGSDTVTWRGIIKENGLPDLNSSGALVMVFPVRHRVYCTV